MNKILIRTENYYHHFWQWILKIKQVNFIIEKNSILNFMQKFLLEKFKIQSLVYKNWHRHTNYSIQIIE